MKNSHYTAVHTFAHPYFGKIQPSFDTFLPDGTTTVQWAKMDEDQQLKRDTVIATKQNLQPALM